MSVIARSKVLKYVQGSVSQSSKKKKREEEEEKHMHLGHVNTCVN